MLQRIVMSTDGSAESEKPLAIAAQVARAQDAELTLLRVVEELNYPAAEGAVVMSGELYEQMMQQANQAAQKSLSELQQRLQDDGVRVRTEVRRGNAAAHLLDDIE